MSSTAEPHAPLSEFWNLRHVGPPASVENSSSLIRLSVNGTISVGRGPAADFFLDSKVHLRLISRKHAEITGERLDNGHVKFTLKNLGLNGTYINDFKLGTNNFDRKILHEGDKVVFGHTNSASIQVGAYAPQPQSEFQFIFEKVNGLADSHPSLNLDRPCCTNDFFNGIHLPVRGANSEHGSVSPKSNSSTSEKENKFCETPLNLSSDSATSKSSPVAAVSLSGAKDKQVAQDQTPRYPTSHDAKETDSTSNENFPSPTVADGLNKPDREPRAQDLKIGQQNTFDYTDDGFVDKECPSVLSKLEENSDPSLFVDIKSEMPTKAITVAPSVSRSLLHHCVEKEFSDNPSVKENCCSLSPGQRNKIKSFKDSSCLGVTKNDSRIVECITASEKYPIVPNKETDPNNWYFEDGDGRTDSLKHLSFQIHEPIKLDHKSKSNQEFFKSERDEMKITVETVDLKHSKKHSLTFEDQILYKKHQKSIDDKHTFKEDRHQQEPILLTKTKHKQLCKDKNLDSQDDTSFRVESETITMPDKDFGLGKHLNHSYYDVHQSNSNASFVKNRRRSHSPMKLKTSPAKDLCFSSSLSPSRTSPRSSSNLAPHFSITPSESSSNLSPTPASSSMCTSLSQISKSSAISQKLDRFVSPKDGLFDSSDENSGDGAENNTPQIIKKIYSPFKKRQVKSEKDVDGLSLSPRRERQGLKSGVNVRISSASLNEKKDNAKTSSLKLSLSPRRESLDLESNQAKSGHMSQSNSADDATVTTINFTSPDTDRSSPSRSEQSPETNPSSPAALEKSPEREYSPSPSREGLSPSDSNFEARRPQEKQETTAIVVDFPNDSRDSGGVSKTPNKPSSTHDSKKSSHQDSSKSAQKLKSPPKTSSPEVSKNKTAAAYLTSSKKISPPTASSLSATLTASQIHKTTTSKSTNSSLSRNPHSLPNKKNDSNTDSGLVKEKCHGAKNSHKTKTDNSSSHMEIKAQNSPESKTKVLKHHKDCIQSDLFIKGSKTKTMTAPAVYKKQNAGDEAKVHQSPLASTSPANPETLSNPASKHPKLKLNSENQTKKENPASADVKTSTQDIKRKLTVTSVSDELAATLKSVKLELSPVNLKNFQALVAKSKFTSYKIPLLPCSAQTAANQPKQTTQPSKPPSVNQDSSSKIVSSSSDKKWKKQKKFKSACPSNKVNDGKEKRASENNENAKSANDKSDATETNQVDKVSSTTDANKPKQSVSKLNRELNFLQNCQLELTPERILRPNKTKRNMDALISEEDDLDLIPWSGKPKRMKTSASSGTSSRQSSTAIGNKSSTSSSSGKSDKQKQTKRMPWSSAKGKKRLATKAKLPKNASDSSDSDDDFQVRRDSEDKWNLPDGVQYFDNPCSAGECKNPAGKAVNWVMCDRCEQWYHLVCVDASLEDVQNENTQFVCGFC